MNEVGVGSESLAASPLRDSPALAVPTEEGRAVPLGGLPRNTFVIASVLVGKVTQVSEQELDSSVLGKY